jgi:hypothetical protein
MHSRAQFHSPPKQAQPGGAALRLHACLLRTLSCLRRGDNKAAAPAAEKLPQLLARVKADAACTYEWMALPALEALLHVVRVRSAPHVRCAFSVAEFVRVRRLSRARRLPPCATAPAPAS